VKFHTFTNLENPLSGIRSGLPAFCKFWDGVAFIVDLNQIVPYLPINIPQRV
jgi:hypothetical protein